VCCVLFQHNVLFCVKCIFRMLCLIVVILPQGIITFVVRTNNNEIKIQVQGVITSKKNSVVHKVTFQPRCNM
jgi:hypothetical protein